TIATITGEGGSGGALALAVADRVLMLENSIYSVISPEGCASIMWKDAGKKQQAADALKYTATDVQRLGCVDDVLPEPEGGTQNDPAVAMAMVDERLQHHLAALRALPMDALLEQRYRKFRNIAQFDTISPFGPPAAACAFSDVRGLVFCCAGIGGASRDGPVGAIQPDRRARAVVGTVSALPAGARFHLSAEHRSSQYLCQRSSGT